MRSHLSIHDKNLLIVDDNKTNLILIEAILNEEGFSQTYTASSAIAAYEVLDTQKIDTILMDIMMPEIDGLEATEAIKANKKLSHIPVIMVTATEDDEVLRRSFELGAVDFVRKPINKVELIVRLNTVLESQEKDSLLLQHSRFDAMEEVINMLAHQWRQPLGIVHAIIGTIQAQKELGELKDIELDKSLEGIIKHTNELSQMITNFGDFFKSSISPSLSNPNEAIQETFSFLQEGLDKAHIKGHLNLGDLETMFYTKNLLIQVLTNVIINAKEAHIRNPRDDAFINISSFKQKNKINILIEDNAGGIDSEVIKHIFEPYYTTKPERNGKGLGLFLVKTMLFQQLNGSISASSKNNTSKFLISLSVKKD
ncbi:hybrid sensor histidine kinase/response regulator [Sulfurimonas sp. MAG313]|nr:hybrid sensor histidine kinase/response regulator [Sulfurimonas sp. MAG313]MDF1881305.1 hybrid sensor histidine kinase/response regulator [Sulfurimonas sp. MAG313]